MRTNHIVILWTVLLYNIFPNYLIKGKISEKVMENKMRVLILCTNLPETFLILRITE